MGVVSGIIVVCEEDSKWLMLVDRGWVGSGITVEVQLMELVGRMGSDE